MLLCGFFVFFLVNYLKHKLDFISLLKFTQLYVLLKYGGAAACENGENYYESDRIGADERLAAGRSAVIYIAKFEMSLSEV